MSLGSQRHDLDHRHAAELPHLLAGGAGDRNLVRARKACSEPDRDIDGRVRHARCRPKALCVLSPAWSCALISRRSLRTPFPRSLGNLLHSSGDHKPQSLPAVQAIEHRHRPHSSSASRFIARRRVLHLEPVARAAGPLWLRQPGGEPFRLMNPSASGCDTSLVDVGKEAMSWSRSSMKQRVRVRTYQGGPDDDGSDENFVYGGPENADSVTGAGDPSAPMDSGNNLKQLGIALHALDAGDCSVDICAQNSPSASPASTTRGHIPRATSR